MMLLTLLLQHFHDIHHKGQAAQFCWNGDVMVTHTRKSDSLKPKCFHTTEFALPFFPTWAAFLPSSTVFFYMFFQNTHWQYAPAWLKAKNFKQGRDRVHRCRWKGSLHLPHKTWRIAEWSFYYDYLVFMIEGNQNQNQNWNSIIHPALNQRILSVAGSHRLNVDCGHWKCNLWCLILNVC